MVRSYGFWSCALAVNATNPADGTPKHACKGHEKAHKHGPSCGHPAVPHGGHVDYLVDGHLHHRHGDHCDDQGAKAAHQAAAGNGDAAAEGPLIIWRYGL